MKKAVRELEVGDVILETWSSGGNQSISQVPVTVTKVWHKSYGTMVHVSTPNGMDSRFWNLKRAGDVEVQA